MASTTEPTAQATNRREGQELLVSVVIPCLNEAETIERMRPLGARGAGRERARGRGHRRRQRLDRRQRRARASGRGAGRRTQPERGYGSAYLAGFAEARGKYIVMADADLTYDFAEIPRFVKSLEEGADMVIGNRMENIQPGAMPWLHRYIGNPILTGILNLFFRTGVSDAHCGMRGIRRDVLPRLDLRSPGMEFASEMVIRAAKEHSTSASSLSSTTPAGGESKLSTWSDGWRHLRFLLVHSPTYLFIIPGFVLFAIGTIIAFAGRGGGERPRAHVPGAHVDRRLAADDRGHADDRYGHLRARLRLLPHG